MSQAEHDTLAAAVLVTDSTELADIVEKELATMVEATLHSERICTSLTSEQSAIVMVRDIDQGLEVVNAYAAEHLEIQTADAAAVAARVPYSSVLGPRSPWVTTRLDPPTCCRRQVLPATPRDCRCVRS